MKPGPAPIPHGATARRLAWAHLPPRLRRTIEDRLGSPVTDARSCDAGFTPGFASVLTCADGTKHFVKAASATAQPQFAGSYRDEAHHLRALPAATPAAPLRWSLEEDWVVLGLEYVAGRAPRRPWRQPDLDDCLDALEVVAAELSPVPRSMSLAPLAEDFASLVAMWSRLPAQLPQDLGPGRVAEAATLAGGFGEVAVGDTVVHTDLRDDNVLLTPAGAVFCDWNWPAAGPAWVDSVLMLIGPRGDGLDVEGVLARRALTRSVPAEHVDRLLAVVAGHFLASAALPVPPTSPHLRHHQRWQGEVCWDWLAERRGW